MSPWRRYFRLWLVALEARTELLLYRWTSRTFALVWASFALGVSLLCLTGALLVWLGRVWGWLPALLVIGVGWLLLGGVILWKGASLFRRSLPVQDAAYRLRLAEGGLRLMEAHILGAAGPKGAIPPSLWATIGLFLWRWGQRWLVRKLRQWIGL